MVSSVLLLHLTCNICCRLSETYSFLRRDIKEMDPEGIKGGEELGGMEGGEAICRIYFMRKESIFNLK